MIDVHYASLTSQGVQHRVLYLVGHPSRYQPRPTGLNFGEQTGTGVFPLVIAVPPKFPHCRVRILPPISFSRFKSAGKSLLLMRTVPQAYASLDSKSHFKSVEVKKL